MSFILCALACSSVCAAPDPPAAPSVREQLQAGEIVSTEIRSDGAGAAGRMQVLIRAPARAVWEVIVSCELAVAFVDGLEACEVLEDTGERALVRQVVNQSWLVPTYDYVFESLRRHYERIDFRLLEGNLRALEGHWVFTEVTEGTFVEYQIRIQPSMPAPRFLVRRNINKGMPDMLACIRGLADGSGSDESRKEDLGRCPGPVTRGLSDQ